MTLGSGEVTLKIPKKKQRGVDAEVSTEPFRSHPAAFSNSDESESESKSDEHLSCTWL